MSPTLDRTKPYTEIRDATGSVSLEQDGQQYNLAGEPMGHTPQPTPPVPEPEPVPPPERDPDEGEEDQDGTTNHEEHRRHRGRHGVARK